MGARVRPGEGKVAALFIVGALVTYTLVYLLIHRELPRLR